MRVALSAKQTGFAARMRTGHRLMSPEVERILKAIIDVESGPRTSMPIDYDIDTKLARLRFELQEAVSTMLADTILPPRPSCPRSPRSSARATHWTMWN